MNQPALFPDGKELPKGKERRKDDINIKKN